MFFTRIFVFLFLQLGFTTAVVTVLYNPKWEAVVWQSKVAIVVLGILCFLGLLLLVLLPEKTTVARQVKVAETA